MIIIDGGSTDGTIEVLKNYEGVEFYYDIGGTRGSSRQIGISKVSTEWFFFLDSDVIIHDGWFGRSKEFMTDKIGAIQGWEHPVGLPSEISDFWYAMDKISGTIKRQGRVIIADIRGRGFTGCVLIRTQPVKNIKIPPHLHDYEDWYIKRHIENKGYKWLIVKNLGFTHFHRGGKPKDSYYLAYIATAVGHLSFKKALRRSITILPKLFFALYSRPNFKMASYQIKSHLYTLADCLKSKLRTRIKVLEA